MLLAVVLFAAAVVLGFAAPRWLTRLATPNADPRMLMSAWLSTLALFVIAMVVGPIAVVTRADLPLDMIPLVASSCLRTARQQEVVAWLPYADTMLGGTALVLLGRVGVVVARAFRRHRRATAAHLNLIRVVGETRKDGDCGEVVWLRGPSCTAYSIGGRRGTVVAGEGLSILDPCERSAVLAHEYAHIRGRHHVLVMLTGALAVALPFVPVCRQGAVWMRILVELAAERRAAHRHGFGAVRDALIRCEGRNRETPTMAVPMQGFVEARLRWLAQDPRSVAPRSLRAYSLGMTASAVPVACAGAAIVVAVAALCLGMPG